MPPLNLRYIAKKLNYLKRETDVGGRASERSTEVDPELGFVLLGEKYSSRLLQCFYHRRNIRSILPRRDRYAQFR